jgi:hypothetical protein
LWSLKELIVGKYQNNGGVRMRDFVLSNWLYILIALIFAGYVIYLIATKNWPGLRTLAYGLMLKAERLYAEEDGAGKLDAVIAAIYKRWPLLILIISTESLKKKLQKWYDKAKDKLDDGVINNSIKIEPG